MPGVTSTNTNAPTILIAEKGAAIIKRSAAKIGGVATYDLQSYDLLPLGRFALPCKPTSIYCAARTRRPGRAPVSEPFSNTGVPATRVAR